MSWWTKAKKTIKKGFNAVKDATQTDIGKLVTGQALVEGGVNTLSSASQIIQNPTALVGGLLGGAAMQQNNNGDSSNTQPLANPTSTASENSGASQQTEQGVKNITGSSDNPGKYSAVNNGGIHYGL